MNNIEDITSNFRSQFILSQILAAFAGITLVTSLASGVYAEPIAPSHSTHRALTLSGVNHQGIQSRNIAKDYKTSFSKPLPEPVNNNSSFAIHTSPPARQEEIISELLGKDLGDRLEFQTGESFDYRNDPNQSLFSENSGGTNTRGAVLYKLTKE